MGEPRFQSNTLDQGASEPVGGDFELVESAVLETERGRWFLREFARRQRADETAEILGALDRLMRRMTAFERFAAALGGRSDPSGEPMPRSRADLGERLAALAEIDALDVEAKVRLFA